MSQQNMRELSRAPMMVEDPTIEDINCGSLQRIADAAELMTKRYTELIADRDRYKVWFEREKASGVQMGNSIRSLKGANTKLRERLQDTEVRADVLATELVKARKGGNS